MRFKFIFLMIITTFILSWCMFDIYQSPKYGELAVDSWFSDKYLGETRKTIENIDEIVSRQCNYLESKSNRYVFSCKIVYKEKGETVIPLSKNSTMKVYAVFIKESGNRYNYKVYNSSSSDCVWKNDIYLNY